MSSALFRSSLSGTEDQGRSSLEEVYALARVGVEGFMVIDGPDDHITTVPTPQEAWRFPSHQGAAMAARTITRFTGEAVEVVKVKVARIV